MANVFDKTTDALGASLNYRLLRHNVTSSNIANAETPGYKAKIVNFEEALSRAVELGDVSPTPIGNERVRVEDNPEADVNNDRNTVDLDKEMTTLAENSVLYKAALALINKKMAMLKYGITEGGR